MRTVILLSALAWAWAMPACAQDDLYYTPSKSSEEVTSSYEVIDDDSQDYIGCDRDVDEYNRRGRSYYYQKVGSDSLGNDIIEFYAGDGYPTDTLHVYPGTDVEYEIEDDYEYSDRMSRYDDYYWYDPDYYWYDYWYYPYWYARWGWYGPWYSYWYDPWYYSWWWGYYPYHHWHHWYAWGGYGRGYRGHTGTRNVVYSRAGHRNSGYGSRVSGSRAGSRSSASTGGTSTSSVRSSRSSSRASSYYGGSSSRSSVRSSGFSGGSRGSFSGGSRGGGSRGGGGGRR